MWKFWLGLVLVWLALMPPLFTDGACTREFERAAQTVERLTQQGAPPEALTRALSNEGASVHLLTPENCRQSKPRFLSQCGSGAIVYGSVPVSHRVCRFYRDSETRFQVHFDAKGRAARVVADMDPFKSLPLPVGDIVIHWAR